MHVVGEISILLAAAAAGDAPDGVEALLRGPLPLLVVLGILAYFIVLRPERKRQAQYQEMLGGLKKNDRVVTAGGIYGTVVSVNVEQDEVVLKVDEANNTRLRVRCSAIRVPERQGAGKPGGSKPSRGPDAGPSDS